MAATCVREAVARSGIDVKDVGHVVFGNVIHTEGRDQYLARFAGVNGGLPHETPAPTGCILTVKALYELARRAIAIQLAREGAGFPAWRPKYRDRVR